jgi:DNA-binding transcriptional MerR regulator
MGTQALWRVGELARRTGVSVRTLHWYEECGLLVPAVRSEAGHRLYDAADLAKLQRIRALVQLGFSLEEIRGVLADRGAGVLATAEQHLALAREELEARTQLVSKLEALVRHLQSGGDVPAELLFASLEAMAMRDRYFTPEMKRTLEQRRDTLGPGEVASVNAGWHALVAEANRERARGTPPDAPAVRALAERCDQLVERITGGDPALRQALVDLWHGEPDVARAFGVNADRELFVWMRGGRQ